MQLYNCTLRLSGSPLNEVSMTDVSAAEIKVLKALHASEKFSIDVVANVKAVGTVNRDDETERAHLVDKYGRGVDPEQKLRMIERAIGIEGMPLPQTVPGVDSLPPPKTGRRATKADIPDPIAVSEPPVEAEADAELELT